MPFLLLCVSACSNNNKSDFKENRIIDSFPVAETIANITEKLDINDVGILDFRVVDSLLLVSTEAKTHLWHIYHLPDMTSAKKLLDIGAGPYEVSMHIPFQYTSIIRDGDGNSHVCFFELPTRRLIDVNLSRLNEPDMTRYITERYNQPVSTRNVLSLIMPNGNTYSMKIDIEDGKIRRKIMHGTDDITPSSIVMLNDKYSVDDVSLLNTILSFPLFSPDGRYIADIKATGLINIIDLNSDTALSVTRSDKTINEASNLTAIQAFDEYFTVINFDSKSKKNTLEFIGWDGSPLLALELPVENATFTYINNGSMYILDPETDVISSYDISSTLDKIKP